MQGDPIKIPYNYRPTPTLQLMSKVAKFTGQRKEQMYGAAPSSYKTSEQPETTSERKVEPLEYKPNFNFNTAPVVDPTTKLLDPSYKEVVEEAKQPVRNQTAYGSHHTAGVVGSLLNSTKMAELAPNPSEYSTGKKIIGTKHANFNIIGGQPPNGDPYATTAQNFNEGVCAALDDKPANRKKILMSVDPKQMISPITGELIADYGTWASDLERKRQQQEEDAAADAAGPAVEQDPLMAKLKEQLASRGAKGVIGLARVFKIMDDDGSNTLSFNEFSKAMKECGLALTAAELIMLFKRFDRSNTGSISYNDFLRTVAGSLNARRRRLVDMAFSVLDRDGSGQVDLTDMAMAYDVSNHPDFKTGKRSKEDILREFLEGFDVGGERDGVVTREEFANYYSNISASIGRDDYFELMIRNAWHISGGEGAAANSANTRVLVTREDGSQYVEEIKNDLGLKAGDKEGMMARLRSQGVSGIKQISRFDEGEDNKNMKTPAAGAIAAGVRTNKPKVVVNAKSTGKSATVNTVITPPGPGIKMLITRIKNEMKVRGSSGFIGLQRRFRIMDDDGSKSLSLSEFKKAMKELKLDLSENDLRQLFEYFDVDSSGSIDFEEFIQGVRDPMTENRARLVNMAFDIIDKDGSGEVDGAEMASMYDASKHPEVLSRRKSAAQVLKEFLDTFDVGGVKDGKVTREEFLNYYANISASIDNEEYFELMIRNAWHISGGEGNAANSTNMRVLVTDFSGNERRVLIENDLGLKPDDLNGIYKRLTNQGVKDIMAINGKMLKKVNVNGVDIVTAQGVVSQIIKDENKVNVNRAPPFSRGGLAVAPPPPGSATSANAATAAGVRPLGLSGPSVSAETFVKDRGVGNINLISRNGQVVSNSRSNVAGSMYENLRQKTLVKSKAAAEELVCSTLLDVLRVQLLSKGPSGIIELQRKFIEMDADNSQSLDKNEFKTALLANNLTFSDPQIASLFTYFDTDRSGTIDYTELLNGLRGELSPKLLVLVHSVFDLMDREGSNTIDPEQLLTHFDPSRHPDVLTGLRQPDEVLKEFLDTFDVGGQQVGKITRDEFVTYYTNIRAALNDDDYFELMLRKCWHLKEDFAQNMEALRDMKINRIAGESSLVNRIMQAQQFGRSSGGSNNNQVDENGYDLPAAAQRGAYGSFSYANSQQERLAQQQQHQQGQVFPPRRPSSASATTRRPSAGGNINNMSVNNTLYYNNGNPVSSGGSTSSRPQSAGSSGPGLSRGALNRGGRPSQVGGGEQLSESAILRDLKAIQTIAVQAYNAGDYQESEKRFIEALAVLQMIYPPNHPECIKAEKSVSMVQNRIQSLQK